MCWFRRCFIVVRSRFVFDPVDLSVVAVVVRVVVVVVVHVVAAGGDEGTTREGSTDEAGPDWLSPCGESEEP